MPIDLNKILYQHNLLPYQKLINNLNKNGKACAVHATGTGKMFLALKWLLDNPNELFAYIAPTNIILNKFLDTIIEVYGLNDKKINLSKLGVDEKEKYLSNLLQNVHFYTYAKISQMKDEEIKLYSYKRIVLDEFHRCGADEWGKAIFNFLAINNKSQVLGLSATPIRPSDGKNMVDELFGGIISSEISLHKALQDQILPTPMHICAVYSFSDDINNAQKALNKNKKLSKTKKSLLQKKIDEAKRIVAKAENLPQIFNKNLALLPNKNNAKFIVFCKTIEDMQRRMKECTSWFDNKTDIHVYDVSSQNGKSINKQVLKSFEDDETISIKLLFSVDMLNEGLHVKNIDGVIMLRPTESDIVFTQQLGRALSVGKSIHQPMVFDLVNNIDIMRKNKAYFDDIKDKIGSRHTLSEEPDLNFTIQEQLIDILDFLDDNLDYSFDVRIEPLLQWQKETGLPLSDITQNASFKIDDEIYNIGHLISNLRSQYKSRINHTTRPRPLTNYEVEILESMGMSWKGMSQFEDRIKPLVIWQDTNNLPISKITSSEILKIGNKEYKIGRLIYRLRESYNARNQKDTTNIAKLKDNEVQILEKMGMVWTNEPINFDDRIMPLILWQKHNNLPLSKIQQKDIYIIDNNKFKIGDMITYLRVQYKARTQPHSQNIRPLNDNEVLILEKMGICWKGQPNFDQIIEPLVAYYNKTKQPLSVVRQNEIFVYNNENIKIGKIISRLREKYNNTINETNINPNASLSNHIIHKNKKSTLTKDQIIALEKMGMAWTSKTGPKNKS